MTPIELVDFLVDFIKEATKDYDLSTKLDRLTKAPEVHPGYLPPKVKGDDSSEFPYVIVRYLSEDDNETDTVNLRLIIATHSEDEQNGWRDTLNIATRIKIALKKNGVFGPFSLVDKVAIELFEEQPFPHWFAVMDLSFNIPQVQFEWSDDFGD